jgi:hypothetical protein
MAKLTKAQRDLLVEMRDDERGMVGAVSHYAPAKVLVAKGLATWRGGDPLSERLTITDLGRAQLSENSNAR